MLTTRLMIMPRSVSDRKWTGKSKVWRGARNSVVRHEIRSARQSGFNPGARYASVRPGGRIPLDHARWQGAQEE
jgi:hypothetical protein